MLVTSIIVLSAAIILSQFASPISHWARGLLRKSSAVSNKPVAVQPVRPLSDFATSSLSVKNMTRTPVYFLSHGGPNIMEDVQHPAYKKLQEIGREITQKVKPKGVVVFSAHWQAEPRTIQVNTAEITDLIYE